jgi:archaellum biogenesis protein FlaJ (TadC family)
MLSNVKRDIERADRMWYGSVFGSWCVLSAVIMAFSLFEHGTFRLIILLCYLAVFALALRSFVIAMKTKPPTRKLSFRIIFMTLLAGAPWIVGRFLQ